MEKNGVKLGHKGKPAKATGVTLNNWAEMAADRNTSVI